MGTIFGSTHKIVQRWPKSLFSFFRKRKDRFSCSPIMGLILDVLRMSSVSHYWHLVGRGQGAANYLPMHETAPQQRIIWPKHHPYQETSQTTFDTFNLSQVYFSCIFTFLEIIKDNMPKILHIFFHLQY